jgi:sodium/hydrogen antiporter
MDPYVVFLAGAGAVVLLLAWVPMLFRDLPLSLPIFCLMLGVVLFWWEPVGLRPDPLRWPELTERLSELVVIVSLMGAGLKLDRPLGWRRWGVTWRLLAFTMPLSILAVALLGSHLLGLAPAAALLLGAVLAPTDPVLASEVQVGPPRSGGEDDVRFGLTSEAGLNDSLAFPFVNLALAMALARPEPGGWLVEWFTLDVAWKLGAGVGIGWLLGRTLGYLAFRVSHPARLAHSSDGFVAFGMTMLSYGLAELVHAYGFVAVFVTALMVRDEEREHQYHEHLHDFSEQIERLLMMVLLVLFGGALAAGLLDALTWEGAALGLLFLALVRPGAGLIGLAGAPMPFGEKLAISFFGIRGVGSLYYVAYALNEGHFTNGDSLWAVVGFVVLVSILLHGISATPAMARLDRARSD